MVFSIDRLDSLDIDHGQYLPALQPEEPRLAFYWQGVIPILVNEVNYCFENHFAERTVEEHACAQDCVRRRPEERVRVLVSFI